MVLESLKEHFELAPADEAQLRSLLPLVRPEFQRLSHLFQSRLLSQRDAREPLAAARQLPRLGRTFVAWLEQLLQGPWDQTYYERRCREGRFLARIGLAQRHVVTAVGVIRIELDGLAQRASDPRAARTALDKVIDFDLAIMADAQREEELLAQALRERAATMGQLVGTMGHELRGPLSVMESSLFILQSQLGSDERVQKHLTRIGQQIGLANRKITGMLDLIRDRPLHRRRLKVAEVVEPSVANAGVPARIKVILEGATDAPDLLGDLDRLEELLRQLLENSLEAIGDVPGEIRISSRRGSDQDVVLSISDSGPGVDSWLVPRLFEPLVTSRAGRLGLGLALVRRIAELHMGRVDYESGPPHRFIVSLPQA